MRELLLFQFHFRKGVWAICGALGALMAFVFFLNSGDRPWISLVLVFVYAQLIDRMGNTRKDEEFIPRLALPVSKRGYIGYAIARTAAYYALVAFFCGFPLAVLHAFVPRVGVSVGALSCAVALLALMHATSLVVDCLTSMRGGAWVGVVVMVAALPGVESFSGLFDASGIGKAIGPYARALAAASDYAATHVPAVALISLALSLASILFAFAWARRIRL